MFGNFSLFKTPFPGQSSVPTSFVSFFLCVSYSFLPPFEDNRLLFGCMMSSASIQKLFCGIYSAFKCSFDEFVQEKVVSLSYSSTILGPPLMSQLFNTLSMFVTDKETACNTEDPGSIPRSGRSPGEGHGNSLQYSCLENSMDREAWWVTVHGIAKSWTRLSD